MSTREIIASVLLLSGSMLSLIGGIGLHRFPDVFARMHAASKPATLGIILVLSGAAVSVGRTAEAIVLGFAAALQLLTAPIGAHMVARAAYRAGTELSAETYVDELRTDLDRPRR